MTTLLKSGILLLLLLTAAMLLWRYQESRTGQSTAADPVRLSLEDAVSYQYDALGNQNSRLSADTVLHLNNGENRFISPEIVQKTAASGRQMIRAAFAEADKKPQVIIFHDRVFAKAEDKNQQLLAVARTERLQYNGITRLADTDSPITVNTPDSHTTSDGAQWQMAENLFILKKNVRSIYVPTP